MKIGIDARLWNETGVGRYIRNLISELQKIDTVNSYVIFVKDTKQTSGYITQKNWEVVEANVSWHTISEQVQMPKILAKYKLDLVHFPYFSVPIMYPKPYVVTIHDLIIDHFPTGKASTKSLQQYHFKRFFYKQILKSAVGNAKAVIVPSQATEQEVLEHYHISKRKLFVTHEGYEKIKVDSSVTLDERYFLYVGNAYPHKNISKLIDAFEAYKKETQDTVKLYLVGKKDHFYTLLQAYIGSKNLEKYIKIKSTISDSELVGLYKNAEALLAPSLMEGFGLTPLEAMNNKCLVAVSDIPAFREICADAALYFDPHSIESIKNSMVAISHMSKENKKIYIMKGVERATGFSWQKMAEETLAIYESSVSVRSR
jgi:glycosyltransferase involved in cell wall biosynthesis